MRFLSAITRRPRWCTVALLSLTMAASGACHHSARGSGAPLPDDLWSINAYLGAFPIAAAPVRSVYQLRADREVVVAA